MSGPTALAMLKAHLKNPEPPREGLTELTKAPSVSSVSDPLGDFQINEAPLALVTVAIPDPEREGIMRFGGGLPASWARVFSALHPDRPPEDLTREQWRERLDAILTFGDRYAHDLERLGWDAEKLFAVGQFWQRLDQRGVGWFVAEALAEGGKVTYIGSRSIRYVTNRGAGRTIWNEMRGLGLDLHQVSQ
ncbi:MAG: hypothetical protein ACK5XZ_09345 [Hyphomonadaceae bacterium]|jgi:hypothetical protein